MSTKTTPKAKTKKAGAMVEQARRRREPDVTIIPGYGRVNRKPEARAAQEEARWRTLLAKMDRTLERLDRQQEEIDRLKAETQEALQRMRAA